MKLTVMRTFRCGAIPIGLLLFLTVEISLHPAAPELEIAVGYGDRFKSGSVTPVSVVVRSPDEAVGGELILEYTGGTALARGGRRIYRQTVALPDGVPGIYRFVLPMEVSSYPLTARLEESGRVRASSERELRSLNVERPLIVGLSRRPSLDSLIPVLNETFGRRVELVYPRSEFLPERAEAWESADLVIWHDLAPAQMDPDALDALALWVEGGGELIVIGGPWFTGRSFPESLPIGEIGGPLQTDAGTYYRPVSAADGGNLQVSFPLGGGTIRYVARDMVHPEIPPGERSRFWDDLLRDVRIGGRPAPDEIAVPVFEAAFRTGGSLMPGAGYPVLLAGISAVASSALLIAGRRSGRIRIKIAQVLMLAVISAAVSSVAVLRIPAVHRDGSPMVFHRDIRIVAEAGPVSEIRYFRFFSPFSQSVRFHLGPEGIVRRTDGGDLDLSMDGSGLVLNHLSLEPWHAVDITVSMLRSGTGPESLGSELSDAQPFLDILNGMIEPGTVFTTSMADDGAILVQMGSGG